MLTIDESVTIAQPRDAVWEYIATPENFPVWMNSIIEFTPQAGWTPEVGDRARQVMKIAGKQIESTKEVTEAVPKQTFAFTSAQGPMSDLAAFHFEDVDEGTRLSIHAETPGLGGVFGKVSERLVTRMVARDLRAGLDNLKAILEES